MTNISWTTETWNPIVGCSIDTKGCTNCYAMRQAWRFSHNPATPQYHGTAKLVNGNPVWTGKVRRAQKALQKPLRRKTPTTYFVNSMGDLFHEDVPDEWIDQVFAVMALCPQHTFQILTKRAERMREYITKPQTPYSVLPADILAKGSIRAALDHWPLPNVWLGVSVEDQITADLRIPLLLDTPAEVRFVSCEPLLMAVDLEEFLDIECWGDCAHCDNGNLALHNCYKGKQSNATFKKGKSGLDWVICGGESGPNARPMHPDWARSLRDQCVAAGVPFHFKQWGEWAPAIFQADQHEEFYDGPVLDIDYDTCGICDVSDDEQSKYPALISMPDGGTTQYWTSLPDEFFDGRKVQAWRRVGKTAAGRLLDGREWLEMPEVTSK